MHTHIHAQIHSNMFWVLYLLSGKKDQQKSSTTSPPADVFLHFTGHEQITWPFLFRKEPAKSTFFERGRGLLSLAGTNHDAFMYQTQ